MEPVGELIAPSGAPEPTRAIAPGSKALVLFNEKAGSVAPGDRERLIETLAAAGIEDYALVGVENVSARLFQRARTFDVIIVLGGDGTARAAAELAPRGGPPRILLAGGTLNILPRALYGERSWPEALAEALERGVVRQLPVGRANGEAFYVAALFGGTTLLARAREAMREGRPLTAWRRFQFALKRSFTRSLGARSGRERMRKVEAVGVLLPAFSGGIEADDLEWVRLEAEHILDLARVSLRALTQGWRDDDAVEVGRCKTGDVSSLGIIHATLDGEPRTFVSRVHIKHDKRGPLVLALEPEEA
jgi:diacylglycerol kinase family enzyme